jgi:hypothetical protein
VGELEKEWIEAYYTRDIQKALDGPIVSILFSKE